ncbi:hypothetical protein [Variovorax terrae]|uniref:Uncharacterized protein n=1 Tax=Variovorax terrae TaxID=2923278 RepID=A0A9X1W375_9BURK|nr:hypothetical protein [Variovorax terrae]MCJ0765068.1 hypothetical protein [Variovorax terrae]
MAHHTRNSRGSARYRFLNARRQILAWSGGGLLFLGLTGCAANWTSIYRNQTVTDAPGARQAIVTMDAKQRAVHSVQYGTGAEATIKLCAEQAPDIFSVISASANASASATATAEQKNLSASLAQAIAESGGAIERSQTVNLLAMSLYRSCERQLNNMISDEEMTLQAARDQRMLVSVLAIEQLTNMIRPQLNRTSAFSGGSAGGAAAKFADQLTAARDDVKATETAEGNAKKAYDAVLDKAKPAEGKEKDCTAIADTGDQKDCQDKKLDWNAKKKKADDARKFYDSLAAQGPALNAAATAATATSTTPVQVSATLSDVAIQTIASTVSQLASLGVTIDYQGEMCVHKNASATKPLTSCPGATSSEDLLNVQPSKGTQQPAIFIYPQVAKASQRAALDTLLRAKHSEILNSATIYLTEAIPDYRGVNVLRYFRPDDKASCSTTATALGGILKMPLQCIFVRGYENRVKPGQMEIWLGPDAIVPS